MSKVRSDWEGGVVRSHEALDEADLAFWASKTPTDRFVASVELSGAELESTLRRADGT